MECEFCGDVIDDEPVEVDGETACEDCACYLALKHASWADDDD